MIAWVRSAGPVSIAAWIVALVLLFLHGLTSGNRSLWFDEAFSWQSTRFPFADMLRRLADDVHPPLYYVVLRAWTSVFGDTVTAMRMLSAGLFLVAAAGVGTLGMQLGHRLGRTELGGIAVLLFLAMPSGYRLSQEVRMYNLGAALAVWSTWLLWQSLETGRRRTWLGYAIAAAGLAYTHHYGLFTLTAQGLFAAVLLVRRRGGVAWRDPLLAAVLFLALYVPFIPTLLRQRQQVEKDYWISPVNAWSIPRAMDELVFFREDARESPLRAGTLVLLAAVSLVAVSMDDRRCALMLAVCVAIPPASGFLVSLVSRHSILMPRYLYFTLPFLCLTLAATIAAFPRPARWVTTVALFGALFVPTAATAFRLADTTEERAGLRSLAERIVREGQPGDTVLCGNSRAFFSLKYHAAGRFSCLQFRAERHIVHYGGSQLFAPEELIEASDLARLQGRIWLVELTGFEGRFVPIRLDWTRLDRHTVLDPLPWQGTAILELYQANPKQGEAHAAIP